MKTLDLDFSFAQKEIAIDNHLQRNFWETVKGGMEYI